MKGIWELYAEVVGNCYLQRRSILLPCCCIFNTRMTSVCSWKKNPLTRDPSLVKPSGLINLFEAQSMFSNVYWIQGSHFDPVLFIRPDSSSSSSSLLFFGQSFSCPIISMNKYCVS